MSIHTDSDDARLAQLAARHAWFEAVLEFEYGEKEAEVADDTQNVVPDALNWLALVPEAIRYDFDEVECSLAYFAPDNNYACTVWDVTGGDDCPWAVFVVDDFGARLLPEYSILNEEADDATIDDVLARAADELPDRAERGDFNRTGTPVIIPDWLTAEPHPTEQG